MNRIVLIFLLTTLLLVNLAGLRNWQQYTNTTHIYDMTEIDNRIYMATWGGLNVYDLSTDSFIKEYTTVDGLQDLDIRTISYQEQTETILMGTFKAGINRLQNDHFLVPLNDIIGLADNKVNAIVNSDSLIYAATDQGLTVFKDVEMFPYPLPIGHYATHNGLPSNRVSSLALSEDGVIVCGTDNGLAVVHTSQMFDVNAWQHFHTGNSLLGDNRINSVSVNNGHYAVATRNGLLRIDDINDQSQWVRFDSNSYYPEIVSGEILTAFIDSGDNIWFSYGIWNESVLYIDYPDFDPEEQNPEDNPAIYAVIKISPDGEFTTWLNGEDGITTADIKGFKEINNKIHAYTWDLGFFFLEGEYWHNRRPNCIVANNIVDISIDSNRRAWIANGYIGGDINRKGTRGISGFDGFEWINFRAESSPLTNNRIFRTAVDQNNRKWFGGWGGGISIYDEDADRWYQLNRDNGLSVGEIGEIVTDNEGNIWVSNYTGGMFIFAIDAIEEENNVPSFASFHLYDPQYPGVSDVIKIHITSDKAFFGSRYSGIRFWDDPSFPQTSPTGQHWRKPPFSQLSDTYIYDITSRKTHFGEEVWIAAENGLFMFETNTERWYRYGTSIKRELWSGNQWIIDRRYFIDEERLYGAAPTFPTAVLCDPFNRIWIGTETNGLTLYDLDSDRYSIYNRENSPLLSNNITSLAHEPYSGNLYIGSDEGLHAVEIGRLFKDEDFALGSTIAYPNPFKPDEGETLIIANNDDTILPQGKNKCRIYNISGELIITLEEDRFFKFSWDGRNSDGKKCGSGVYYYVVASEDGETSRGTIALVR